MWAAHTVSVVLFFAEAVSSLCKLKSGKMQYRKEKNLMWRPCREP